MRIRNILFALIAIVGLSACNGAQSTKKAIDEEALAAKGLVISQTNFPDANLCKFLLAQGYGADHVITPEEMATINTLIIDNMNIQTLQGIENFTGLVTLSLNGNPVNELQLGSFSQLQKLQCRQCGLKKLNFQMCKQLQEVDCSENLLDSMTVNDMPALTALAASGNGLEKVTLKQCPQLKALDLSSNKLIIVDLSQCAGLRSINVAENPMSIEVADFDAFVKSLPTAAAPTAEELAEHTPATLEGLSIDRLSQQQQNLVQQKGWKLTSAPIQ